MRIQSGMRMPTLLCVASILTLAAAASAQPAAPLKAAEPARNYVGFDANEYPGDARLPALRKQFAFTGYWLTNPPGATSNPWLGKRDILLRNGFGFLVVADGRFDKEILKAQKTSGTTAAAVGRKDAAVAIAAARREGFPPHTIVFLDQEEGGRMLPEQAEYLLAWTETVGASAYRPGVYGSGLPVNDGKDPHGRPVTITTIQDIREHVAAKHLHSIAFWVYQDACPPSPGCVVMPAKASGKEVTGAMDSTAWQYAQSPRRSNLTRACGATYDRDGSCYVPGIEHYALDLNVSGSADPSHGR